MTDEKDADGMGGDMDGLPGEETQPMNTVVDGRDRGEPPVMVQRPRGAGCYVTRVQAVLLALMFIVLMALTGFLVAVLSRPFFFGSDPNKRQSPTPKPTVSSYLPWSDIRLPETFIPSFYKLELKVNLDNFTFSGWVEIDTLLKESDNIVIVHVNDLTITKEAVTVQDMTTKKFEAIEDYIPVPINQFYVLQMARYLTANRRYKIRFGFFEGQMKDDLRGLYRSKYKDDKGRTRYLAASQLQSVDARKVFPCFDEPHLKANFSVSIVHQGPYVALSNMPVESSQRLQDGWYRQQFEVTPIMSTYLLAFVVAEFKHRDLKADGLEIRIWSRPEMFDQTSYALSFAEKAYQFFAEYFGMPEVVPKADHVATPDFSAGAMENWGLVLYRETALLHDETQSSISNQYWVSLVMAHEIAHTWFGNMATMKWWDDLWLNEGFANTLMYFALDRINPGWKVFDLQLVNNIYPVMTKDSLMTSHAISTPIEDPDDISQYFDMISYDKGMAVLRLLRGFVGWDEFKKGLQIYVSRYKFKNAEMSQLWQTFAEAVNHKYDVVDIMDTWTRQMGFPVVSVRHLGNGKYRLDQERFLLNPNDDYNSESSPYEYKWRIPFSYQEQNGESKTVWMQLKSAEIQVEDKNAWLIGNVNYTGFFRTNYDEDMWRKLTEQLLSDHLVFSAANRAGLITDAFNLARANKLNYAIALNLTSYLHNEVDYVPWKAFLDSMDFIKGMLSTSNSFGLLKQLIFDLVAPMYKKLGMSDQGSLLERNLRRAMLQAASSVGVPYAIDSAKKEFENWAEYGSRIPPDFAAVIYAVGIQQGGEKEWDKLWEESQITRVASESELMMNALAYTQKPWLLWRYARWSLDSNKIRMQNIRNLFRYFASTPLGRSVALQFLLTNWEEINRRFGMDAYMLRDIIHATTSLLNTEYQYKQLERLYLDHPPAGVASKAADNSLALIRSNINWMKLNHDTIHEWLKLYVTPT